MKDHSPEFDAGEYWRSRVVSGSDLAIVGHRSMGRVYNGQIYERRLEVLGDMVDRHRTKPVEELRVLDIGCGSGFYTGYWAARGVRSYTGVDISPATIQHLSGQYADYEFVCADITEGHLFHSPEVRHFDVVTVFDVLYHIVDDERFASAVTNIGFVTEDSGVVFVMDQLGRKRYQLSKHVVYRDRREYVSLFKQCRLSTADNELLFHFLVPPLSGYRPVDWVAAGFFKLAGLILRLSDRLANWTATFLRRLDTNLRLSGSQVSNSEFLVFRKSEKGS